MNYLARAMELQEELVENRRYLHQNPQLGFELNHTVSFVRSKLEELGLEVSDCGPAGLSAVIGDPSGPVFLLRADMDALPVREESGLPFAASGGQAHACGHDMHTAMLLGAAKLLKEKEHQLSGAVKLMVQPAEEILEGAKSMIAAGILEQPAVDAAMALHMLPGLPTGILAYNTGTVSASSDAFQINIQGVGGHGAQPNLTIDPVNTAAHIHLALQELIAREADPKEAVVLTIGSIQAGNAHNVIPETAVMKGTLRTFRRETRLYMLERLGQVADYTAKTFRAQAELELLAATGCVTVDEGTANIVVPAVQEALGYDQVMKLDRTADGSEDFSEISERVPSMFFVVGCTPDDATSFAGLHSPEVFFDEESLPYGAAAYAAAAHGWLEHHAKPKEDVHPEHTEPGEKTEETPEGVSYSLGGKKHTYPPLRWKGF
ncbi:MAG: M20 family metallopeptidase [Clostridiales bacterium]|nr:M20 family metallopeptidase [Clostridiales bacterium]